MANSIYFILHNNPPFGIRATAGGSGGSGWNGTYSFLVLGWDTDEEYDVMNARVVQYEYNTYSTLATYSEAANVAATTGQEITVTWAHPHPAPRSHYSVYFISGASADILGYFTKILPASGVTLVRGNIPPTVTSATFTANTGVSETRLLPILSKSIADNTITVPGDISISLDNGTYISLVDSGTDTGTTQVKTTGSTNVVVSYSEYGRVTTITTLADLTDTTTGMLLYYVGSVCFQYTDLLSSVSVSEQFVSMTSSIVNKEGVDITGRGYEVSQIIPFDDPKQVASWQINILHSGLTSADLYELNRWQDQHKRVALIINVDTGLVRYPAYYVGHITSINDHHTYEHYNDDIQITFTVEYEVHAEKIKSPGFDGIVTATAGGAGTGTIIISGYHVGKYFDGRCVRIQGSTGNDGYYSINGTPTYSSANNQTTLKFGQSLPDGTDDGRIVPYDL